MMTKNTAIVSAVVAAAVLVLFWLIFSLPQKPPVLTLDYLPKGVAFIDHPEDAALAEKTGGVAMTHYATPEALEHGGPIFGTLGYRIISIEYEIPASKVGNRMVGRQDSAGENLIIESLKQKSSLPYNHFHLGIAEEEHSHHNNRPPNIDPHDDTMYVIHFMLISHEEEVGWGLVCG